MGSPHSFMALLPILATLLLLLICAPSVQGAISNTTVDDADSAFTFTGSWTAVSASNPCNFCSSKPDASQTFDGSWHDGNYRAGASETTGGSFTFTGSAVYIFGIDQAKSQPNIAFTLGSTQSVHHYTGTEQFAYNALFFSATGLAADQTHTVTWNFNIDPDTGVGVQAALFDYAIVTSGTDDVVAPPTTQTTTSSTTEQQGTTQTSSSTTHTSTTVSASVSVVPAHQIAVGSSSSSSFGPTIASQSDTSPTALSATSTPTISVSGALTTPAPAPQSAASSKRHTPAGAIAGAVIGVLLLILGVLLFILLLLRRRRRRQHDDAERRAQPFVAERAPAHIMADDVFATSAYSSASSGVAPAPAGTWTGTGTFMSEARADTGTCMSSAPTIPGASAPPPAFEDAVGAVAAADLYPAEKTEDVGYTNPHAPGSGPSRQPSRSGVSRIDTVMSRTPAVEKLERDASASTVVSPSTALTPADTTATTTSARERYLEERLATLEAHVASYLPPPYEPPEP